jgi:hypothetical protein
MSIIKANRESKLILSLLILIYQSKSLSGKIKSTVGFPREIIMLTVYQETQTCEKEMIDSSVKPETKINVWRIWMERMAAVGI